MSGLPDGFDVEADYADVSLRHDERRRASNDDSRRARLLDERRRPAFVCFDLQHEEPTGKVGMSFRDE